MTIAIYWDAKPQIKQTIDHCGMFENFKHVTGMQFPASLRKTVCYRLVLLNEPGREKTNIRGFWPGLIQTGLYSLRRKLESWNFG